jgi:hypothetical protein
MLPASKDLQFQCPVLQASFQHQADHNNAPFLPATITRHLLRVMGKFHAQATQPLMLYTIQVLEAFKSTNFAPWLVFTKVR